MKVRIETRTEEELEECDYRDCIKIWVDDELAFFVQDDEPEDSNLGRSFSACYNIPKLMLQAFEAGKRGESFELSDNSGA